MSSDLQEKLNYTFSDPNLLVEALTHSSFANEHGLADNERLEFLGDSILDAIVGRYFFQNYPVLHEGELTRLRSNIVNTKTLCNVARRLEVGERIMFGKGEARMNGKEKESNLANAMEAIIGAIFLDSNFEAASEAVIGILEDELKDAVYLMVNYKGQLQELCQKNYKIKPVYKVEEEEGEDHDKIFTVSVKVGDILGIGKGKNIKEAEQLAAKYILNSIQHE